MSEVVSNLEPAFCKTNLSMASFKLESSQLENLAELSIVIPHTKPIVALIQYVLCHHGAEHLISGSQSGKPWMDDLRIEVCENTRCSLCGVVQDSYYGHWKSVFCPEEGLIGDTVELYHDSNQIHFCDIEIFGRPIDLIAVETE